MQQPYLPVFENVRLSLPKFQGASQCVMFSILSIYLACALHNVCHWFTFVLHHDRHMLIINLVLLHGCCVCVAPLHLKLYYCRKLAL